LRRAVRGTVRFDAGSRALYATDASNFRQVPIGVVEPLDGDDVEAVLAVCRRHRAPVLPRGGGTSLAGQCCNVAVVLDSSRHLCGVLELDPERRLARVLPGTVLDDLRGEAAPHGLTFGPDPATHAWCTLGGMIGNNSCGVHSLTAGRTSDNVEALEIVTYDGLRLAVGATSEAELAAIVSAGGRRGEIYGALRGLRDRYAGAIRGGFPKLSRRVSGYNLDDLLPEKGFHLARALVGSEGTCATLLAATLRLVPSPVARVLLVLGFPDVLAAARAVPRVLDSVPEGLEGMDRFLVDNDFTRRAHRAVLDRLPAGNAWLLVEFGGESRAEAAARARDLVARWPDPIGDPAVHPSSFLVEEPAAQSAVWQVREAAVGTTSRDPRLGDGWPGWEDAAVPPERLAGYLEGFYALLGLYGYSAALYGHFGEGCLHARIDFDFSSPAGIATYRGFLEDAADLVTRFGGSLSGEHGDGQQRGELLGRMFGPELVQAFREFKRIWDPENRMNPGKKVDPLPLDADLRPALPLARHATTLAFADDHRDFARAVTRCVGVGRCRKTAGGTMCPSYRATGEERHSTRGRARLLFEMLQGEVITGSWRSAEVEGALDLCLGCKACRSECPAGVDMAAYKAEFRHQHYRGRLRPRSAYALGQVAAWLRLASRAPGLANAVANGGASSRALKWLAGIHPERALPPLAEETFRAWFSRRPAATGRGEGVACLPVVLWVDTFSEHLQPEIARAAVAVLERAGCRVLFPSRPLCCGRPLYDYGFLDQARRGLRRVVAALAPAIAAGLPLVVLEPSCLATFRDELLQLLPDDAAARRLSGLACSLAELLNRPGFALPPRPGSLRSEPSGRSKGSEGSERSTGPEDPSCERRVVLHGHCHQKALGGFGAECELLGRLGVEVEILDSGCCGMAGAFGFEREHYEISLACGEQALLPAVRAAESTAHLVADGFSCREQVAQATGRRPLHLAELLVRL
jgi:FAD/FMN-containing dehydrogenase/Fe-S oxidoreductase